METLIYCNHGVLSENISKIAFCPDCGSLSYDKV